MTVVTARVALKTAVGVEVSYLSTFLQDFGTGLGEELVDRTLDENALHRVLFEDDDADLDMRRDTGASYEAITKFMTKEKARRRKAGSDSDGYKDFENFMKQEDDGKGGSVWVRTENVQKWRASLRTAAPST